MNQILINARAVGTLANGRINAVHCVLDKQLFLWGKGGPADTPAPRHPYLVIFNANIARAVDVVQRRDDSNHRLGIIVAFHEGIEKTVIVVKYVFPEDCLR